MWTRLQSRQLMRQRRLGSLGLGIAAVSASLWASQRSECEEDKTQKEQGKNKSRADPFTFGKSLDEDGNYLAVFLLPESKTQLERKLKRKFHHYPTAPNVLLRKLKAEEDVDKLSSLLGKAVTLTVHGLVEDEEVQSAAVSYVIQGFHLSHEMGPKPQVGHMLVSSAQSFVATSPDAVEQLVPRIKEALPQDLVAKWPQSKDASTTSSASGSQAKFSSLSEPLELNGVLCLASNFDNKEGQCVGDEETMCSWCHFMRKSPCGNLFRAWERCVDASKQEGEDFISKCAKQTVDLHYCLERNTQYFAADDAEEKNGKKEEGKDGTDEKTNGDKEA